MCNSSPVWVNPVDNSVNRGTQQWATPVPAGIALLALGIALAVASAASYTEPPAMVLLGVAALATFLTGLAALMRRPRLALSDGPVLTVGTLRGRYDLTAADIESIELLGTRRLAFRSRQLLIEESDDSERPGRLLVFGQWDLGANPAVVAGRLADAGFSVHDRTGGKSASAD